MLDWVQYTSEYQNWGWNIATVSAAGTIVLTTWQLKELYKQYKNIYNGESLSVILQIYFTANFIAYFIYAWDFKSVAMVFGSSLALGYGLVLFGLWWVKEFSRLEKRLMHLLWFQPLLMLLTPSALVDLYLIEMTWRQVLFLLYSIGTIVSFATMPYELYRSGKRGDLSYGLLVSLTASTVFWWCFAVFAVQDFVLGILTTCSGVSIVATFILWRRLRT